MTVQLFIYNEHYDAYDFESNFKSRDEALDYVYNNDIDTYYIKEVTQ